MDGAHTPIQHFQTLPSDAASTTRGLEERASERVSRSQMDESLPKRAATAASVCGGGLG